MRRGSRRKQEVQGKKRARQWREREITINNRCDLPSKVDKTSLFIFCRQKRAQVRATALQCAYAVLLSCADDSLTPIASSRQQLVVWLFIPLSRSPQTAASSTPMRHHIHER